MTEDRPHTTEAKDDRPDTNTRPGVPVASELAELDDFGSVDLLDTSEDSEVWRLLDELMLVYEGELASSEDPRIRTGLAYELGRLFECVRGDQPRAAQLYQRALSSNPTHLPSMWAGRRLFAQSQRWGMALRLLDVEIRSYSGDAQRARLVAEMGEIYLERFKRYDEARRCFQQAFEWQPKHWWALRMQLLVEMLCDRPVAVCQLLGLLNSSDSSEDIVQGLTGACLAWVYTATRPAERELIVRQSQLSDEQKALWDAICTIGEANAGQTDVSGLAFALRAAAGDVDVERLVNDEALDACAYFAADYWGAHEADASLRSLALVRLETRLRTAHGHTPFLSYARGRLAEREGDVESAEDVFRRGLREAGDREAAEWIFRWGIEGGGLTAMVEQLRPMLSVLSEPELQSHILTELGRELRMAGREKEALRCYLVALERGAAEVVILRPIRELTESLKGWAGAQEYLGMEARAYCTPMYAREAFLELGRGLESGGDAHGAMEAFRSALRRDPASDEALGAYRKLASRLGSWGALADALDKFGAARPVKRRESILEAARIRSRRTRDTERAIRGYESIIREGYPDLALRSELAELYLEAEEWERAARAYKELISLSADTAFRRATTFRLVSLYREKLGDLDAAQACLVEILENDPHAPGALFGLAVIEEERGDLSSALIAVSRAISASGSPEERVEFRKFQANIHLEQGRAAAAVASLEAAAGDGALDGELFRALGDAASALGDWTRSRLAYERAESLEAEEGGSESGSLDGSMSGVVRRPSAEQLEWMVRQDPLELSQLAQLHEALEADAGPVPHLADIRRVLSVLGGEEVPASEYDRNLRLGARRIRDRLRMAVDSESTRRLSRFIKLMPELYGPMPFELQDADNQGWAADEQLDWFGAGGLRLAIARIPVGVCVRSAEAVYVSDRLVHLDVGVRSFFVGVSMELGRRGLDVLTRMSLGSLQATIEAQSVAAGLLDARDISERARRMADRLPFEVRGRLNDQEVRSLLGELLGEKQALIKSLDKGRQGALVLGGLYAGGVAEAVRGVMSLRDRREQALSMNVESDLGGLVRWAVGPMYREAWAP